MPSMQEDNEELDFVISLSGTYWRHNTPEYEVYFDGELVEKGNILYSSSFRGLPSEPDMTELDYVNSLHPVNFKRSVAPGEHTIQVRFPSKDPNTDTLLRDGKIVQDLLLTVEKIRIDGVDLNQLIWAESVYEMDQEHEYDGAMTKTLPQTVTMGHPGTWTMKFTSPFYLWLLERI